MQQDSSNKQSSDSSSRATEDQIEKLKIKFANDKLVFETKKLKEEREFQSKKDSCI